MPTRREFLKLLGYLGAFAAGTALGFAIGSSRNPYSLGKEYQQKEIIPENQIETITITVTKTLTNTQVPQTVTKTITTTETVTKTLITTLPTSTTTQPSQNLEQILFGNSNIQFIPLEVIDVKIDNNTAYLTVVNYRTKTELQIELPIQYVSNGNINIKDLLSGVNNYNLNNGTNYKVYFVLGRANINQAIQQNGKWILPAPQIYYNIIISDRGWEDVYNAFQNLWNGNATIVMPTSQQGPYANSLWGWNNGSIIILYQNGQQINSVLNYINLANSILGKPNNPNPSSQGTLHVDTIVGIQKLGFYENRYPVVGVNNYLGTYIVFIQAQGSQLFSNL